jgi:hypothetical protein
MATLPRFVTLAQQEQADLAFRAWAQERARAYVLSVRARRAYVRQCRMVVAAVVAVAVTGLFVSWQVAAVITWLLNN